MVSEIVLFSYCCCCCFGFSGFGELGGLFTFCFCFWLRVLRHGLVYVALVGLKFNYIDQAGFKLVASASAFMVLGLQWWAPFLARTEPFSSPSELNSSYLALITAMSSIRHLASHPWTERHFVGSCRYNSPEDWGCACHTMSVLS